LNRQRDGQGAKQRPREFSQVVSSIRESSGLEITITEEQHITFAMYLLYAVMKTNYLQGSFRERRTAVAKESITPTSLFDL